MKRIKRKGKAGLAALAALALGAVLAPAAASAAEVNLYSDRQAALLRPVIDAFEEESGIKVNILFAKGAALLERARAEGAAGRADVFMMTDIGRIAAFAAAELLAPVNDAALRAAIPAALRDPGDLWFAATRRGRIIYAAPEVSDSDFASYLNLADGKWRGEICARSGTHPYNIALIASVIANEGVEVARGWVYGWKRNLARRPEGNDRAQIRAVAEGKCKIAVANTYYFFKLLDAMDDAEKRDFRSKVRMVFPAAGAHINISAMGLARNAPNRGGGIAFMRFLAGPAAQRIYAEVNGEFPARADIPLPPALAEVAGDFVADDLPLAEIAAHRAEASRLVEEAGFNRGG